MFGAAVGFAFASVGRNTAGALGVGFAYFVVVENLVHVIWPRWHTWLVSENATNFLLSGSGEEAFSGRSSAGAGLYLLFVACLLLVVAAAIFRTRDVT